MNVIPVENAKPIFSWCPEIEQGALDQLLVIAKLPFVKHIAIMPDGHLGMKNGAPIGSVIATEDVIIPNFVGIDQGCGVIVIKSSLKKSDLLDIELRKKIHASVCRGIPMGFNHNNQDRIDRLKTEYWTESQAIFGETQIFKVEDVLGDTEVAFFGSLGTLGGGNHYLSLDCDENEDVWIQVHSGSRNLGLKIGEYFNKTAIELNKKWYSVNTSDIPFLPIDTDEGKLYLKWMDFALRFAFLNRQVMIDEMIKDISYIIPETKFDKSSMINIHHNYASLEHFFGKDMWVHRKGAVMAREGVKGIIPGSMNSASFITEGLGNPQSLCSSSHGAGRNKGRKAFNIEMNTPEGIEQIKKSMEGVVYSDFGKSGRGRDKGMLDVSECPAAYKNIERVMEHQKDLVKPIHKLTTMINWKDSGE